MIFNNRFFDITFKLSIIFIIVMLFIIGVKNLIITTTEHKNTIVGKQQVVNKPNTVDILQEKFEKRRAEHERWLEEGKQIVFWLNYTQGEIKRLRNKQKIFRIISLKHEVSNRIELRNEIKRYKMKIKYYHTKKQKTRIKFIPHKHY